MLELQIENTQLKMRNLELTSTLMQNEHNALAEKLKALQAQKAAQEAPVEAVAPPAPEAANG